MGSYVPVDLSVRGALDTANPSEDRPPGTLVVARDLHTRWWGPRPGSSLQASSRGSGAVHITRDITAFNGTDTYLDYPPHMEQFGWDREWTVDVLFEFNGLSSGDNTLAVFDNGVQRDLKIYLLGTGAGASHERKVRVYAQSSDGVGLFFTPITLTGTTQLEQSVSVNPAVDPTVIHHVRVVRNGQSLKLYVDGVLEASSSGMSSVHGNRTTGRHLVVGRDDISAANSYVDGWIYKVLARIGSYEDLSDGWVDNCFGSNPSVAFNSICGPAELWITGTVAEELSRYRNLGTIYGTGGTSGLYEPPMLAPVQAISSFTDRYGRVWNLTMVAGRMFFKKAQ